MVTVVIGAGIIGTALARDLRKRGRQVVLVDRDAPRGCGAAPDDRRAKVTVRRARLVLPGLRCEDGAEGMGHRPALPDTVPILSTSAKTKAVFYATRHGHLGQTYAATTARPTGDLITATKPAPKLHPYRVNRF